MKPVRILIADHHEVIREGLRLLLERQPGWNVCAVTGTGLDAVTHTQTLSPDVVILEMSMPDMDGLAAAIQIKRRNPSVELVIFTEHQTDETIRVLFESGIKAYICKSEPTTSLLEAVKALSQHRPYFTDAVSKVLLPRSRNRTSKTPRLAVGGPLSWRERQIVRLLAEGKSNKEVADILGVSVRTVETHRANIISKLGLRSLAGLVRYAVRHGIIEP